MSIVGFRELREAILDYEGARLYDEVLDPWIPKAKIAMAALAHLAPAAAMSLRADAIRDSLWNLFALSVVIDHLIDAQELARFMEAIGASRIRESAFHPFWHEIVEVEEATNQAQPPAILREVWPGFVLGDLMLVRAGVRVSAGSDHLTKAIAERSTIYFTNYRAARPASDLSHGWGHNSRWRTSFRRDYAAPAAFHYHVDGKLSGNDPLPDDSRYAELTREAWIELVRHRCFVRCAKPHDDLWPYDLGYVEPRGRV